MKRKITIQLSEEVAERLEAAAERPGASKSAIVEAALDRFLSADHEAVVDDATLLRRLDWMSGQLERLDRDLRVVGETAALHARYHLTVTPPRRSATRPAATIAPCSASASRGCSPTSLWRAGTDATCACCARLAAPISSSSTIGASSRSMPLPAMTSWRSSRAATAAAPPSSQASCYAVHRVTAVMH
jgi:predicted transcriptional regulator